MDFESALPDNYTLGSNAEVKTGTARNGDSALYFYTDNFGESFNGAPYCGGYMSAPNIPGKRWGRMYYLIDDIVNPAACTHTTFVAAKTPQSEMRLVDTARNPEGTSTTSLTTPAVCHPATTGDAAVSGFVWSVNGDTRDYAFYHNGTIVNEISRNFAGDHGGVPDAYEWMKCGGQAYHGGENGPKLRVGSMIWA